MNDIPRSVTSHKKVSSHLRYTAPEIFYLSSCFRKDENPISVKLPPCYFNIGSNSTNGALKLLFFFQ